MASTTHPTLKIWCWLVVSAALAVTALGLLNLGSIGAMSGQPASLWTTQLLWSLLGLGCGVAAALWGQRFTRFALVPYGLALAVALAVALGSGVRINGASQWLALPGVRLHSGTLLQLGLITALTWCVHRVVQLRGARRWWIGLALPLGLVLVPLALLYRQPDMVSMLIALVVAIVILALELRTLVAAIVLAVLGSVAPFILWSFVFGAYQRQRLAAFLDPGANPEGAGYHSAMSVKLVHAGQLGGQGWGAAGRFDGFLPDAHSTGVLAVWTHEWGALGAGLLLGLLLLLVLGLIMVARRTEERFGAVFAAGTAVWLLVQAGIHVGSTLGLIPYLGAKLPLVSFGGSGVVFTLGCVGLVVGSGLRSAGREQRR